MEQYIKKEILDDDTDELESVSKNSKKNDLKSEINIVESTDTSKNDISNKSIGKATDNEYNFHDTNDDNLPLRSEIDINSCLKIEMSDECTSNKSVTPERLSKNDDTEFLSRKNEFISETNGNINKPFEFNTDMGISKNFSVTNNDILSLHTEVDIDSCVKNEISDDCASNKSVTLENLSNDETNSNMEYDRNATTNKPFGNYIDVNRTNGDYSFDPKSFMGLADLQRHQNLLPGEPYKCEICNKLFTNFLEFINHSRVHTVEKSFKCQLCSKTFTTSRECNRHKRIHTGERPYVCDICNLSFNRSNTLKRHYRIHTGEKPYKCEVCNKSFSLSSNFKNHIRTHTGEKPYKCEICNKSFTLSHDYKIHNRTHTGEKPYKCEICNKSFITSGECNRHSRNHTGERPYKCDICNKAFNRLNTLNRHFRIHTVEKPK